MNDFKEDKFFELDPESLGDFDKLADTVLNIMTYQFGFKCPSITIYDPVKKGLRVAKHSTPKAIDKLVTAVLKKEIKDIVFPVKEKGNAMVACYLSGKKAVYDDVGKFVIPFFSESVASQMTKILSVKKAVVFPVISKANVVGVFGLGLNEKRNLTPEEEKLLQNLAEQMGGYLYQAWKLKQEKDFHEKLSEQLKKLKTLAEINQEFYNNIYQLFLEVKNTQGVDDTMLKKIDDSIQYLQSLNLIHDECLKKE